MTRVCRTSLCVVLALLVAGVASRAQSGPERASVIAGVIVAAGSDRAPIANVRVELTDRLTGDAVAASTSRDGRFVFEKLAAGAYVLSASKPAFVTARFGAAATNRSGTAIVVRRGEEVRDLSMVLQRGAAITGVVFDALGAPSARKFVTVLQLKPGPSGPVWVKVLADASLPDFRGATTDDRGVYRIYGLAPGDYRVAVGLDQDNGGYTLHRTTQADIERARQLINEPVAATTPNGLPQLSDLTIPGASPARGEVVRYTPVYYPGTPSLANAATITLGYGEERDGVDVHLQWTKTARIDGTFVGIEAAPGEPQPRVVFQVVGNDPGAVAFKSATGVPQTNAQFSVDGMAPGNYRVEALMAVFGTDAGASSHPTKWGFADVIVNGADVSGVMVSLRPGVKVTGRVMVDDAPAVGSAKITLTPEGVPAGSMSAPRTVDSSSGTFVVPELSPVSYRISADATTLNGRPVVFEGVFVNGADVTHAAVDLAAPADRDVVVKFTTKLTQLSGAVQDASGAPAPGYVILAFPVDRNARYWHSRAIQFQKLSSASDFDFRRLPSGEYFLAALTDIEPDQEFNSAFLDEVAAAAVRVTLAPGVPVVQNLRVGKGK